jgi:hypothetical protein
VSATTPEGIDELAAVSTSLDMPPTSPPSDAARVPERRVADRLRSPELAQRAICLVAALGLLVLAQVNFGVEVSSPWRAQLSPLGFALALALAVASCTARSTRALNVVSLAILAVAIGLTAWEAAGIQLAHPGFSTDEGAYVQYATHLLLNGKNPYTHSLAPALGLYGRPPVPTALTNGSISTAYVYPSLPVLLNVPFYWITNGVQSVVVAAVFFQCLAGGLLYCILPREFRALAVVVVFEIPLLFGFAMAGSFYPMLLPLAIFAIWRWTEIGSTGRISGGDVARAISLGLACAVEQIVWIIALFLAVGVWRARSGELGERNSLKVALRYVAIVVSAFVVVNLPFIVWSAGPWSRDVISAFTQHSIPYGEGLIDLTVFLHAGGGNLSWYSDAALLLLLALLVGYALWFNTWWQAGVVLAGVMFFVSTRPLDGYWLEVAPLWLAAVLVPGRAPVARSIWTRRWSTYPLRIGLVSLLFAPAMACVALALTATSPLRVRIQSVGVESNLDDIWQVVVRVSNLTINPVTPHFALNSAGQLSGFWNVESGPTVLNGRATAVYTLSSPNLLSDPSVNTPFVISAVLSNPDSISTSPSFLTVNRAVSLSPSEIDYLVPVGRTIVFRAQLENGTNNSPISQAHVPIAMEQLILDETHVTYGDASINGEPTRKHLVVAETNSSGVATFRVRVTDVTGVYDHPIYLRAFIYSKRSFSYGASDGVLVMWHSTAQGSK